VGRSGPLSIALAAAIAAVALWAAAPSAVTGEELGYCDPAATAFDPADVPAGGSPLVRRPNVSERFIRLLGVRTRVLQAGPRRRDEAVVFMHGSPGSATDWAHLMPRLAKSGIRSVAFDVPGFGHASDTWGQSRELAAGARFFGAMMRRLGVSRIHLVGHDIGGVVGLEWASHRPRALRSATLVDSGLMLGYRHHSLAQISRTPGAGESFWLAMNREAFASGMQNGQKRPLPASFTDRIYDDLDRETRCAIIGIYRSTEESEIRSGAERFARVFRRWKTRPALVIWGADDPYIPAEMAQRQRRGFPSARVHVLSESGHWPFVDHRVLTRRLIVGFLRRQARPSRPGTP
jgi:pimeloyl-ACP methyl ester carboxylesterase